MVEVEFRLNNIKTIIECNTNEKIDDILNNYTEQLIMMSNDLNFVYDGKKIEEGIKGLTFNELANNIDKERKKINILVYDSNREKNNNLKLKEIICNKCGENSRILIDNYKVNLYGCKNGHETDNISFEEFVKMQNIDESKIVCDACKQNNKGNSEQNKFYKCNACKMNLCPSCKSNHDNSHNIIDYELRNYMCEEHNAQYKSYCKNCKKNICESCLDNHKDHEIYEYDNIEDKNQKIKELNELKEKIDIFNININEIKKLLDNVMENIEIYYNICSSYINNYDINKINYETIENINKIINRDIIFDINRVIGDNNINNIINKIIDIDNMIKTKEKKKIIEKKK
jgi:hypothetical protein